jgi:hypothetical protein
VTLLVVLVQVGVWICVTDVIIPTVGNWADARKAQTSRRLLLLQPDPRIRYLAMRTSTPKCAPLGQHVKMPPLKRTTSHVRMHRPTLQRGFTVTRKPSFVSGLGWHISTMHRTHRSRCARHCSTTFVLHGLARGLETPIQHTSSCSPAWRNTPCCPLVNARFRALTRVEPAVRL